MTNEELVILYQQGNKQALDTIVMNNKGMVYMLARRFNANKTNSIDEEDLIQEGYIGLMIAAKKYDPSLESKAKFITYATYWINSKISRYIAQRNTNEESSLNVSIGEDKDQELMDTIEGIDYSFENIEEKIYIEELRQELEEAMLEYNTLQQREVIKLRYGWNGAKMMKYEDIADVLNVSRSRVNSIENTAIRKLRHSVWGIGKYKELYDKEISLERRYTYGSVEDRISFEKNIFRDLLG